MKIEFGGAGEPFAGLKAKSAACPYTARGTRNHTVQSVEGYSHFMKSECEVWARVEINSEPNKKAHANAFACFAMDRHWESHSHFMKSECGVWARVEINSEPNKRLRLTPPLLRA